MWPSFLYSRRIHMYVSICVSIFTYVCVDMCVNLFVFKENTHMCIYMCVNLFVLIHICVSVCVSHMCIYMCVNLLVLEHNTYTRGNLRERKENTHACGNLFRVSISLYSRRTHILSTMAQSHSVRPRTGRFPIFSIAR